VAEVVHVLAVGFLFQHELHGIAGEEPGRVKTMSEAMISEGIATTSRLRRYQPQHRISGSSQAASRRPPQS
jgi:hypothetical protein